MRKVIISLIYVSIVLTIPLAVACQGVNFTYQCYELQRINIFFFIWKGKKQLSEKRVSRILGISYPDDMPDGYHGQDPRIWVYIKDK